MAELVVKSNALIQASYTLGLVEQRLILMSIVGARETGEGITAESLLIVRAQDYAALFGVTKQTAYQALADAVETLFNRRATVDVYDKKRDRTRPMTVRWVTAMAYEESEGLITLRFGHEVVPELTRLESNFTSYELEQVAGLKSAYAVRLYELLIQWRTSGKTPVFEINHFRNQLGLGVNEYQRMHHFKARVLDLAITQINDHTDIKASYEQVKTGRNITGFTFKFKQKSKAVSEVKAAPKEKTTPKDVSGFAGVELQFLKSLQARFPEITEQYVKEYAKTAQIDVFSALNRIETDYQPAHDFTLSKTD
jgi:plasmid replication initiation protein